MKKIFTGTLLIFLLANGNVGLEARSFHKKPAVLTKKSTYGKKEIIQPVVSCTLGLRDYDAQVSEANKKDLRDVVITLAQTSLTSLSGHKSRLKEAGDRIDFLHPFKFLYLIISDLELRGNFRAIRDRSWVWKEFRDNLIDTLVTESKKDNLQKEQLNELAGTLNVSIESLYAPIQNKKWNEFVEGVLKAIPKTTNDRTGM